MKRRIMQVYMWCTCMFVCASAFLAVPLLQAQDAIVKPEQFKGLDFLLGKVEPQYLDVLVKTSSRCMFGDFDVIAHEISHSRNTSTLLSLKHLQGPEEAVIDIFQELSKPLTPLANGSPPPALQEVEKFFRYGKVYRLDTSKLPKPALYAITICKESEGRRSCRGKQAKDFQYIMEKFRPDKAPAARLGPDIIYYYNLIYLGTRDAEVPQRKFLSLSQDDLFSYLDFRGISKRSPVAVEVYDTLELLDSHSLQFADTLILDLPRYSAGKCEEKR